MCDPVTVLVAATVGSTLLGAYSQVQAGKQEEAWGNYQAAQAEADANAERGAGQVEAERIRKLGKRQRAEADAAFAGSGIAINEGSALDINRDITQGAEEDAYMAIVAGNDRGARLDADATGARIGAKNAKRAGYLGATATVLGGAAQVASGWKSSKSARSGASGAGAAAAGIGSGFYGRVGG